jgi:hypothetical protein
MPVSGPRLGYRKARVAFSIEWLNLWRMLITAAAFIKERQLGDRRKRIVSSLAR